MRTTPVPGLLHQLSKLLPPRVQPHPAAERKSGTPAPRKMVTGQGATQRLAEQRKPTPPAARPATKAALAAEPNRNLPRGTFLNIVV